MLIGVAVMLFMMARNRRVCWSKRWEIMGRYDGEVKIHAVPSQHYGNNKILAASPFINGGGISRRSVASPDNNEDDIALEMTTTLTMDDESQSWVDINNKDKEKRNSKASAGTATTTAIGKSKSFISKSVIGRHHQKDTAFKPVGSSVRYYTKM